MQSPTTPTTPISNRLKTLYIAFESQTSTTLISQNLRRSISSDTDEECDHPYSRSAEATNTLLNETPPTNPRAESPYFFSDDQTTSDSSSICFDIPLQRKTTLEYGDTTSAASTCPETARELSNASPSATIRRTQSEAIPPHESISVGNNLCSSSQPVASPLLDASLPTGTDPYLIHSRQVQTEMDRKGIAWGVQYEIARGITLGEWRWQDVTGHKLDQLRGCNAEAAPKVGAVMLDRGYKPPQDLTVWLELDREQAAIVENSTCLRSAGLYGDWEQEPDWYGGRIVQAARLIKFDKQSHFKVQLEALEYQCATTRFARFLGSRRILRLSVPSELLFQDKQNVRRFLMRKFILCGRVFLPLRPKDGKVYLVEVKQDFERLPRNDEGDDRRLTFQEIISWHNPMEYNLQQPARKWTSRFDLGLSVSVPVLEFELTQITEIDDVYVSTYDPAGGKASSEQILTDGCGFINRTGLSMIAKVMNSGRIPTAVQGRIAGAKGLWILHPDPQHQHDLEEEPLIWIRKSQKKIKFPPERLTRSHLIFDLVAPNRLSFPSRLSMQTIINLSHNGVPDTVFIDLMSKGLEDEFEKVTTWQGDNAMKVVLHTVAKVANVSGVRLQRQALGMERVLGHGRPRDLDEGFQIIDSGDDEKSAPGRAPFSFEPKMLGEKIFEMVLAGFHPLQSLTLHADLRQMVKNVITSYIKSYHIPNHQSCEAFIVPDPFGILEENEIYFRAWQPIRDAQVECDPEALFGPVLINRNPTRLPSDVQLVVAVDDTNGVFKNYRDIIICSIKGQRSLASKLAGGDYDGDTAMLTWMPEIIDAFRPPILSDPPKDFMETNFQKEIETVENFRRRISSIADEAAAEREFVSLFLFGLSDPQVGLYSKLHENAIYRDGYSHPETIRLAYMFNTILDASKSGLMVKNDVLKHDKSNYDRIKPDCMLNSENEMFFDNSVPFRRDLSLGPFILDVLCGHGRVIESRLLQKYDHLEKPADGADPDILREFQEANKVSLLIAELRIIERHVEKVYRSWQKIWGIHRSPQGKTTSTARSRESKKDINHALNDLRREFASNLEGTPNLQLLSIVDRVKASCAYSKREKFAFTVAYHDLCLIKANANNTQAPIMRDFGDILAVPSSFARLFGQDMR